MDLNPKIFICTYSGDVVPNTLKKTPEQSEYVFQLTFGPKNSQEYAVCPIQHASLGNHFNHSNQNNLETFRILTTKGVIIIIRVREEKIKAGEELTISYNGWE